MAFCNIENKQAQGLAKIIAKDIANKRKAGTPYNIEDAMLYVYNLMIDNNQDVDRAITMAALVPKAVIAQVAQYSPNGAYLAPILGKVGELVSKAANFDLVIDIMGLKESYAQRLKDAAEAQKVEVDTSEEPIAKELDVVTLVQDIPTVHSGLSTTVLEVNTPYAQSVEEDPAVKANGAFIRKFIKGGQKASKNVSEGYVLSKMGTYRLAIVSGSKIPEGSRVNADVYGSAVYAFINEENNIVTDENGHTPHAFIRSVEKTEEGNYKFSKQKGTERLEPNAKNAKRLGMSLESFRDVMNSEASFLGKATSLVSSTPEITIPLDVYKGTLGIVAGGKNVSIKNIKDFQNEFLLPEGTGSGTARVTTVVRGKSTYQAFVFNHPNYDYPLIANPQLIKNTEYGQIIKDILLSSDYTAGQKQNLLFNIVQKQNVDFKNDGTILLLETTVKKDKNGKTLTKKNAKGQVVPIYNKVKKILDVATSIEAATVLIDNFINSTYINLPISDGQTYEFDGPVKEGNIYEVGKVSTSNYIYNNFSVFAKLDSSGRLLTPHPVIYYNASINDLVKLEKATEKELNETSSKNWANPKVSQTAKTEQLTLQLKELKTEDAEGSMNVSLDDLQGMISEVKPIDLNTFFESEGLNKAEGLSSKATAEQIQQAKKWFEASPLSKHIKLEQLFSIVNAGKVAEFTANGIKLFAGSNYTDLYHEGWHGFSQLYLTKAEKVALYKEVRKLEGNITFLEAEEILAEDFRKYRLSNGQAVMGNTPVRRSIFKKILDFLRALFGNTEAKANYREMVAQERSVVLIKEAYDKLYFGKFEGLTPNVNNSFFLTLNKGVEGANNEVLSGKDSKDISDAMDSLVSGYLRKLNVSPKQVFSKEKALEALYSNVYKDLELQANTLIEEDKTAEARKLIVALTNFGDLENITKSSENSMLGYHIKASRYLQTLAKSQDITEILDLDIVDSTEDYMEYYDKGGNEVSVKDLADPAVLYAIRSIRERTRNGSIVKDVFGFDKLADFSASFNKISVTLRDVQNPQAMFDALAKSNVSQDLLDVLGSNLESQNSYRFQMQTAFWQTFNKAFVPIQVAYVRTTVDAKTETVSSLSFRIKRAEGEINRLSKELLSKFQFDKTRPNTKESNGIRSVNVSKAIEGFTTGITKETVVQFYQAIGVLPQVIDQEFRSKLIASDSNIVTNTQGILANLKKLNAATERDIFTSNPIEFLSSDRQNYIGRRSTINLVLELYGESVGEIGSGAKLTAERTTQFESTLNSKATILMNALNSINNLDQLLNSPATEHLHPDNNPAILLNPIITGLFDLNPNSFNYKNKKPGKKLRIINVSGVTTERITESITEGVVSSESIAIDGVKNISLDPYSKLNQDIHTLFVGGYVENVRASDKTTSYAWKITGEEANITPADVINGTHVRKTKKELYKLLAGELATMRNYRDSVLNVFDAKGNSINFATWQTFADETFISKELKDSLYKEFVTEGNYDNALEIYEELMSITAESADGSLVNPFDEAISPKIAEYLSKKIKALDKVFEENKQYGGEAAAGLIQSKNLLIAISKYAKLPSDRTVTENAIKKAFVLETFFRNAAYFNFANLGVASYRNADDIIKRNTTTSTGNLFRTDDAAQAYITAQGRLLEAKHARETGNPVMSRAYTGVLRTALLKEMTINAKDLKAEWYEMVENVFKSEGATQEEINAALEPYRNMDEADGQAYLNMDTYRQLSMASDEWTNEQEYMYQKLVAGESINNPIQYFPVRKYQYTGPILNAGAPVQALHKYSLFPLIPSVIEGTNLEKLNEAMMESGIDYVTYESGSKAARVGEPVDAFTIDAKTGNRNTTDNLKNQLLENVNELHAGFLRDQLRINNQYKKTASFSTQFRKLLGDGIYENGVAKNEELAKAHQSFLKNIDDLISYETAQLEKEINSKTKLIQLIKRELERRDVEDFKIEAIDVDRKGNLKYNLDALPSSAEMDRILNAVVNKRLVKAKLSGESLVQVSSAGFEDVGTSNDLRFYTPGKAAQVKLPLQGEYIKLLLMDHPDGQQIGNLERLNALLKDEQWMDKNRELVSMTGVRIPVQGLNSMEFFEVAEFLPSAGGNIIVVPTEMVAKSGSDFDIDKLTMYFPVISATEQREDGMFEVDTDELLGLIFNQSAQASKVYNVELSTKGANLYKNNIVKEAGNILLHPANFSKLIRPIATDIVKENSEAYLERARKEESLSKAEVFSYDYNLKKQQENSVGKKALGISAKGNTYNTMFQRLSEGLADKIAYQSKYGIISWEEANAIEEQSKKAGAPISFLRLNFKNIRLPFGKIGDLKDSEGKHLKSDVISQIVNGHVDMANDSWIADIGADDIMTPYLLNLIDMGLNYDYAVRFLNAPIIQEYFKTFKALNKSVINKSIMPKTFSDFTVRNILLKKYGGQDYINAITIQKKGEAVERPSNVKQFDFLQDFKSSTNLTVEDFTNKSKNLAILAEFSEVTEYFKLMKSVRLSTDLDTKKSGTIIESAIESKKTRKLLDNSVSGEMVNQLLNNNVLGTFLDVKEFQMSIFKGLFGIRGDGQFIESALSEVETYDDVKYDREAREKFISDYTNNFIQHSLRLNNFPYTASNFTKVESYKGLPVQFVDLAEQQMAIGKNGVILIDPAKVNSKARAVMSAYNINQQEFHSLILEANYIAATSSDELSQAERIDQAAYELNIPSVLLNFMNPNSIVQKYQEMIEDSESIEAMNGLSILDKLIIYDLKDGKMIGIKSENTNVEDIERYHAEIKLLQESTNKKVREFFQRLPEAVVSVEGFKGGRNSLLNVLPFDQVSRKADIVVKNFMSLSVADKEAMIKDYAYQTKSDRNGTLVEPSQVETTTFAEVKTDEEVEEFIKACKG